MEEPDTIKEVEIGFATVVKIALSYNKPPPLCAKDLCKDWEIMDENEKNEFERIFNEVFTAMSNKQ